jgi:DNA repair exonuclease SbcCD ATPase subunit
VDAVAVAMSQQRAEPARLDVERIGGIEETSVELRPGVTALVGRNATNRTSFLQAIMAACGSTAASVKGDAEEGLVTLELDGETYERTLHRHDRSVPASGEAFLAEPRTAELFAFLLESNPVRQAVARGDPLRDLIMEPIDTDAIEAEIARLQAERREIEAELEDIETQERRLPDLQERRERLTEEIEATEAQLAEKRERLAAAGGRLEEEQARSSELDERLADLNERRREREEVRSDIGIEESAIEEIRAEIDDLERERAELADAPAGTIEELDRQIEFVREQKRDAEASMNDLQRIIQFNEEMLDGADIDLLEDEVSEGGSVTDRLVEGGRVVCWTCGSEVMTGAVKSTLERLRRVREDELAKANRLDDRLAELEDERERLEAQRQRAATIDRELESLREEIDQSRRRIERYEERAGELTEEIAAIEQEVERLQERTQGELLEAQEAVNELEFELGDLREEREEVEATLERVEARVAERSDLEDEREAIQEAIVEQRTRIERIEEEAVEQFNAQMDDLLDLLGYGNIERVWLEPREASEDAERTFELHVVRTTDEGATYEDSVAHLSESEREVTAIVFALAGYLAHDVYEEIPFLLLDSLEAIDSERIATLVEYVGDYAEYVVVALLPEDAQALGDDHDRVTEI